MRIGITRWVLIGASLWMGTVRPATAQQPLSDAWTETDAWHLSQVPSKPITAYPAGDLWADFCTEPVYFHHPCGRNDCTGDGTCTLLDGVNAYHAHLGTRCGTCGVGRCSTCVPAGELGAGEASFSDQAAATKGPSRTVPAPVVQGNRARRSVVRSNGQPTPAAPRHQAAGKAAPKSGRPKSVRIEAVDGRPRPVTMQPISPVPLAPADLVAAAASDTAQWVEGIPESEVTEPMPDAQVRQAAAYEPVSDELHEVEVQTELLPAPVVRPASHVRTGLNRVAGPRRDLAR